MLNLPQILAIQQIAAAARDARDSGVLERPRHKGITALFSGPDGAGKSMAAETLAKELGVELLRVDLSAIVNKYTGETEKNLQRIFDAAESDGAILFFDEADALFGNRSEVKDSHDRYANVEIEYLLKCMHGCKGVAILSTNSTDHNDSVFNCFQYVAQFPFS
jgi:SpoVK/Ycf46/Vps4 family AAA+-type ATPase